MRLKARLMTHGVSIDEETARALAGRFSLTLAEYASTSGVTLTFLAGGVSVNAPILQHNPNFVADGSTGEDRRTPLRYQDEGGAFLEIDGERWDVDFAPTPSYHDRHLPDGTPIRYLAASHGHRARYSPVIGCAFKCSFCNIPFEDEYLGVKPGQRFEWAAPIVRDDLLAPAAHILVSGGVPKPKDYERQLEVYRTIVDSNPGVPVDIMMVAAPFMEPRNLYEMGITGLSINLELGDPAKAALWMRNSKRHTGYVLGELEKAVKVFTEPGSVRSLVFVGLEEPEHTLRLVRDLVERNVQPVLSPFRPDPNTPLKDHRPPDEETLIDVWLRAAEIVRENDRKGGSIVSLGPDCPDCQHNTLAIPREDGVDRTIRRKDDVEPPDRIVVQPTPGGVRIQTAMLVERVQDMVAAVDYASGSTSESPIVEHLLDLVRTYIESRQFVEDDGDNAWFAFVNNAAELFELTSPTLPVLRTSRLSELLSEQLVKTDSDPDSLSQALIDALLAGHEWSSEAIQSALENLAEQIQGVPGDRLAWLSQRLWISEEEKDEPKDPTPAEGAVRVEITAKSEKTAEATERGTPEEAIEEIVRALSVRTDRERFFRMALWALANKGAYRPRREAALERPNRRDFSHLRRPDLTVGES